MFYLWLGVVAISRLVNTLDRFRAEHGFPADQGASFDL